MMSRFTEKFRRDGVSGSVIGLWGGCHGRSKVGFDMEGGDASFLFLPRYFDWISSDD